MMRHLFVAALLVGGCASRPAPAPEAVSGGAADRPAFVQYRPEDPNKIRLNAPYSGVLTQRGLCLGLTVGGRFVMVIWPETARLSYDSRGLLLQDEKSKARLRLGDAVMAAGGPLPAGAQQSLGGDTLSTDMPIECAHWPGYAGWIGFVSPGFRRGQSPGR